MKASASEEIQQALLTAHQSWSRCEWDTKFGPLSLNLRGLRSHQARLAAQATRGNEAKRWTEAGRFLESIEKDAATAFQLASRAVSAWTTGDNASALELIDRAIAIEAGYRSPVVYPQLRQLMKSANFEVR